LPDQSLLLLRILNLEVLGRLPDRGVLIPARRHSQGICALTDPGDRPLVFAFLSGHVANRIKARRAVILLDTCESGALTNSYARSRECAGIRSRRRSLHEATGRPVLTAAAAGKPAFEGYRGHGVFTWTLIDALFHGGPELKSLSTAGEGHLLWLKERTCLRGSALRIGVRGNACANLLFTTNAKGPSNDARALSARIRGDRCIRSVVSQTLL
jgi:hypothetical protein